MTEDSPSPTPLTKRPDPRRIVTLVDFGNELGLALRVAGLTVRNVAQAAGISVSTVGAYLSGRSLPPSHSQGPLQRILMACGEDDPDRVREWMAALSRVRRTPEGPVTPATTPYRGLASFQAEDAPWFFGREGITAQLVELATITEPGTSGLFMLVGPSGSGKSSLLRAGLMPSLKAIAPGGAPGPASAEIPATLFTPRTRPLAELAAHLSSVIPAGDADTDYIESYLHTSPARAEILLPATERRAFIVVDQFEEIFGQPISEDERQAFIVALNSLARRAIVVLALRADFYESAKRYPQLESALSERQIVLGAMSTRELRTAIIEPARKARLDVDNGLVAVMLRDLAPGEPVGGRTEAYDPGALPLLAHALLTTWERSRAGKLTLDEYEATGGIQAAIAESAENVYHALDSGRQETARWLFLRLVNASGDAPATRGAIQINELDDVQETSVKEVLERFVEARLITVDSDVARITHGALLTAWRRLQTWIDTSLEDLRIRHHISAAARFWEEAGCDSAALLHGRQLALVSNWATNPHNLTSLSHQEREFVESSVAIAEARKKIARRRSRRRYLTLRWQDLLHAFADGFGGVFALFGYNSPDTAPLPSFESTLADDVHHLCVSLELYKAAEGMSAGEQHR